MHWPSMLLTNWASASQSVVGRCRFSTSVRGLPGALPFDIVDRSFDVLESGVTAVVLPVSEPGVTALLAAALLACGIGRRRGPLR